MEKKVLPQKYVLVNIEFSSEQHLKQEMATLGKFELFSEILRNGSTCFLLHEKQVYSPLASILQF